MRSALEKYSAHFRNTQNMARETWNSDARVCLFRLRLSIAIVTYCGAAVVSFHLRARALFNQSMHNYQTAGAHIKQPKMRAEESETIRNLFNSYLHQTGNSGLCLNKYWIFLHINKMREICT